ncbi:MAG: tRNA (adenosine(37)-N6)-dimethylallyltransferase MiaA, partial [Lachnospirales bacterium]
DSMQVYKYMDIGTAKIKEEEKEGIKHYLIDDIMPDEKFSVAVFQKMAIEAYNDIIKSNKTPIMVGGTGFYLNAFLYDNDFSDDEHDYTYRNKLNKILEEKGKEYLYDMLKKCDSEYANTVHINNTKKVIRALEYYTQTGEKFSDYNNREKLRKPKYNHKLFILNMERELLYKRIDKRVDIMIDEGLVDEVKNLLERYSPNLVSMQGLGYKEIVGYLEGRYSLDEAIYILKRDTRHFAKRQLTWFKHQCNGIWIDVDKFNSLDDVTNEIIKKIGE